MKLAARDLTIEQFPSVALFSDTEDKKPCQWPKERIGQNTQTLRRKGTRPKSALEYVRFQFRLRLRIPPGPTNKTKSLILKHEMKSRNQILSNRLSFGKQKGKKSQ